MVPKQLGSYHSLSDQLAMERLVDQWFGKCSSEVECLGHYKVLSAGQKVEAAEVKAVEDEAIEAKQGLGDEFCAFSQACWWQLDDRLKLDRSQASQFRHQCLCLSNYPQTLV